MIKLPSGVEINNLIGDLRSLSWEASEILLHYSQILKDTNNKSNLLKNGNMDDPVTEADLKVNDIIIKGIHEKYNDVNWAILSEENVKISSKNCNFNNDWVWVLDPLDGTKDFMQGTSNFAMHLALNYKNKPYIGVVLIPRKNELWISTREKVWCEGKNGFIKYPISFRNKKLKEMVIVTSKNHRNQTLKNLIEKVGFAKVVIMGSVGCKIASILRGESDIYICLSLPDKSSPKDWDFSAPEAILKAAGGAITNLDNEELLYGEGNFEQGGVIVATNNYLMHEKICLEIKEIINKYKLYPFSL